MSVNGRIRELSRKHATLEARISDEQKRPLSDSLRLQALKRRKFVIKQAITKFNAEQRKAS